MNTKSIVKGSLNAVSMTMITTGATMLVARDIYGLVLMGVGIALIFYREYMKTK